MVQTSRCDARSRPRRSTTACAGERATRQRVGLANIWWLERLERLAIDTGVALLPARKLFPRCSTGIRWPDHADRPRRCWRAHESIASPFTTRSRARCIPRRRAFTRRPRRPAGTRSRTAPTSPRRCSSPCPVRRRRARIRRPTGHRHPGPSRRRSSRPGRHHSPGAPPTRLFPRKHRPVGRGPLATVHLRRDLRGELLDEMNGTDIEVYIASTSTARTARRGRLSRPWTAVAVDACARLLRTTSPTYVRVKVGVPNQELHAGLEMCRRSSIRRGQDHQGLAPTTSSKRRSVLTTERR